MKRIILIAAILSGWTLRSQAQYTITDSHTAAELLNEIKGENVIVLNPVLSCGDTSNGIFSGTGSLDFDNGIILTTNNALDITPFLYGAPSEPYSEEKMYTDIGMDADINAYLLDSGYTHTEAFNTCAPEFDLIPLTPAIKLDFIFASSEAHAAFGTWGGCDPSGDIPVIFIKGGTEFPSYINLATYPGTNIPVNTISMFPSIADLTPEGCTYYEGAPYEEYYIWNEFGEYAPDIDYRQFSKAIAASANVTPCDTYHLKLAIADIRGNPVGWAAYGSALFFKTSSLAGVGQPTDCTTGLEDYKKRQALIKVSPNPFVKGIRIDIEGAGETEQFDMSLTDIQGRVLANVSGRLRQVNATLSSIGSDLQTGLYFLSIRSDSGKYRHSVKVIKL